MSFDTDEGRAQMLGSPAPNRTDFKSWSRETLEDFARRAADENLALRIDNKVLLQQWRAAIVEESRNAK